jgi:hypothetical protein
MLFGSDQRSYFLPVDLRFAGSVTGVIWAMRNTQTGLSASAASRIMVKRVRILLGNDVTSTPTVQNFNLFRWTAAGGAGVATGNMSGGSTLTPIEYRNSSVVQSGGYTLAMTNAQSLNTGTGLTTGTSYVAETAIANIRSNGTSVSLLELNLEDVQRKYSGIELAPGEGLGLSVGATVNGTFLSGFVFYAERL